MPYIIIGYLALLSVGVAGWIMNMFQLVSLAADPINGLFIIKCIGVIVAPLGAVLGWIG